jgi:hypothetical protein
MTPLIQPLFYEPIYYADIGCRCDMTAEEVVARLKETGIWQLVEEAILTKFEPKLDKALLSSFGWAEVEHIIKARALKAVELGSMEELVQPVSYMGRPCSPDFPPDVCNMTAEKVVERLKETGIWQLVEAEIASTKS